MSKRFRYKNILSLGSFQFCGNIVEYFSENSEKLVVYYVLPRVQKVPNVVRVYRRGRLISEEKLISSGNFIFYYISLYLNYLRVLFTYFSPREKLYFIHGHPILFLFNSLLKKFRDFEMVYWIGDFYPKHGLLLRIYRFFVFFYHKRAKYTIYLSDRINKKMNGKIIQTRNKRTVMWGINPPKRYKKKPPKNSLTLCFIGLIKESQGLRLVFRVLQEDKKLRFKILGFCPENLYHEYRKIIGESKITKQVYFPNKFIENLEEEMEDCHIGIALYEDNPLTNLTDPGKIKTYTQMGLPVIMADVSAIAEFVEKFKAGEVVQRNIQSVFQAIKKIKNHYQEYIKGVKRFNDYFNYRKYYKKAFRFLE